MDRLKVIGASLGSLAGAFGVTGLAAHRMHDRAHQYAEEREQAEQKIVGIERVLAHLSEQSCVQIAREMFLTHFYALQDRESRGLTRGSSVDATVDRDAALRLSLVEFLTHSQQLSPGEIQQVADGTGRVALPDNMQRSIYRAYFGFVYRELGRASRRTESGEVANPAALPILQAMVGER